MLPDCVPAEAEPAVCPLVSEPFALVLAGLLVPEVWAPLWSGVLVD
jgi:hypothetical protein